MKRINLIVFLSFIAGLLEIFSIPTFSADKHNYRTRSYEKNNLNSIWIYLGELVKSICNYFSNRDYYFINNFNLQNLISQILAVNEIVLKILKIYIKILLIHIYGIY